MFFRCPDVRCAGFALLLAWSLWGCTVVSGLGGESSGALRVCSDPNNLPFSSERQDGFENKIAELVAEDLGLPLEYTWWAQRRGFVRNTLNAGLCDVLIGVPSGFEPVLTTAPYYRSTYVFVSLAQSGLDIGSFDDPALRTVTIGVQLAGDDFSATPAAYALSARGIVDNVRGFPIYGDYSQPNPSARIIDAVTTGEIDIAVVWGPLAGYFSRHGRAPLHVQAIAGEPPPSTTFAFDISMGVRTGNVRLRGQLQSVLERRKTEIERILDEYGIPRVLEGEVDLPHEDRRS